MATQIAAPAAPKKTTADKIYDSLTKRLEPFSKKLSPEDQVELDGIASVFSEDVANAFKIVPFFGPLK